MSKKKEAFNVSLTNYQRKFIEELLISTIKQEQNRWIYDKNDEKYRDVKGRAVWFEKFGKSCNPPIPGKQVTILWNRVVNRYSSAKLYYKTKALTDTDNANKIQSKTLSELSFLSCDQPIKQVTDQTIIEFNQQENKVESGQFNDNQTNRLTNLLMNNQIDLNFCTNSNAFSDSDSSISFKQGIQVANSEENNGLKIDLLNNILEKLNEKNSEIAGSNPQITGFQTSTIPLLENYLKISNNDILALEDLKLKVISLIIRETRELKSRMEN